MQGQGIANWAKIPYNLSIFFYKNNLSIVLYVIQNFIGVLIRDSYS
jgi:hypothetical protein